MRLHKILAIGRAARFSPNSVEKDAAILGGVCDRLAQTGCDIVKVDETALNAMMPRVASDAELCITMGRDVHTLALLRTLEAAGTAVVNSVAGVALCCNRRRLDKVLRMAGVAVPDEEGPHGYWLKRADGVAEGPGDVRFAADSAARDATMETMRRSGVADVMVSAHIPGDLVKFYGVRGSRFFRTYYPGDDGQWKFGDERLNGRPQHYAYSVDALHAMAERAAEATATDVYGGDCIVRADGSVVIIDFNDWPSFSRCRDEAADAIATMVCCRMSWKTN